MLKIILNLVLCLGFSAWGYAAQVTCYDDDSMNIVNQDEVPAPPPFQPAPRMVPTDCDQGPVVRIEQDSDGARVLVNGKAVYHDGSNPAIEARVTPTGKVAILTTDGSLLVYDGQDVHSWYVSYGLPIQEFRLARNGAIIAFNNEGRLILNHEAILGTTHVKRLYAGASGRLAALFEDGSVGASQSGARLENLYHETTDPAVSVKVAANGTVVWLTENGRLGSTKNSNLYTQSADPAVVFKVSPSGAVAYLTREGQLGRDGQTLSTALANIVRFNILLEGAVTAVDDEGRALYFK